MATSSDENDLVELEGNFDFAVASRCSPATALSEDGAYNGAWLQFQVVSNEDPEIKIFSLFIPRPLILIAELLHAMLYFDR